MFNLENKVVIVTGGTRGIGFETVKAFLEEKAKVILFGSRKETVDNSIKELKELGYDVRGYYPNLNDFMNIMNLNVNAMFNTIKCVVPYMKEENGGVILNTSSMVSIYGQPSGVGYPASKFAVNGLTKSLARELAPFNIRVNAVAPGITKTDMVANLPKEMIEPLIKTIPLGRIGEPRDIANAFLFLASDMASYITGVILQVDGAAHN